MSVFARVSESKTIRVVGITATKYRIVDADTAATVVIGPVTTGITNTGTLRYKATATMPSSAGDYEIQWDDGSGAWAATEDLEVKAAFVAKDWKDYSDTSTPITAAALEDLETRVANY